MDTIYKYKNRKLYHRETGRYIKYAHVIDLVTAHIDFKIYEWDRVNKLGKEITQWTLSQIVLKKKREALCNVPLEVLKDAIRA